MSAIKRILGYATLGVAKESARRAWRSESYVESAILAAQVGVLGEAAKNLLGPELGRPHPSPERLHTPHRRRRLP